MLPVNKLSKIGIGTWGIGGFAERNPENADEKQINALAYQLTKGMNFVMINPWYSQGRAAELVKIAFDRAKVKRENIFIILSIYEYQNPSLKDVNVEFERFLDLFETDYVDTIEFSLSAYGKYGFENLTKQIEKYLDTKKARYTSVTNFNLEYFKKVAHIFQNKLFHNEVHVSYEIRVNDDWGITDYGLDHQVLIVPYQALRRNRTALRNWPQLTEMAHKYGMTQNQIILNWQASRGFRPLVKSETLAHIDENLASFNFTLEKSDIEALTRFRVPNYIPPEIDWFKIGKRGVHVDQLPNLFDKDYRPEV